MTVRVFADTLPEVAATAYIDPQAVLIGDVAVGEDSSLWPMAVVQGDVNAIRIGARSNVQDGAVLHVT
ncbi:MAG TPA: gamma carbonic anhydrase family protein, partial [Gammaproteobacteria bacterium]|nr:gamma carbonic anhydrase family protein [Gammaproteobacteria bacterium]